MANKQVVVVKNDSTITSTADLKDKKVITQKDSSGLAAINENEALKNSFASLIESDSYLNAMMELESGAVDAIVMDSVVAEYEITVGKLDLTVLPESLAKEGYGIGFRKGSEGAALRDKVWATLEEMAKDGTVAKITTEWFGSDISVISK